MDGEDMVLQVKKQTRMDQNEDVHVGDNTGAGGASNMVEDDSALASIMKDLEQIHILDDKVDTLVSEVETLQKSLVRVTELNMAKDLQYDLMSKSIIKKDKDIIVLRNRVLDLEKRSMNKNIRIRNVPERQKENAAGVARAFLEQQDIDGGEFEIEIAHRTGKFSAKNARQRPIIVQLAKRQQVEKILEATKGDGTFDKDAPRVSKQVPTELRQATAKLYHLASIAKKAHPHAKT
jgi:hypothetical protein